MSRIRYSIRIKDAFAAVGVAVIVLGIMVGIGFAWRHW